MPIKEGKESVHFHWSMNEFEQVFYTMLFNTGKETFSGKVFYNGKTLKVSMDECPIYQEFLISGMVDKVIYSKVV